jgi:peptidoglycan/xylan/chitin deacetylase (PgdA/CDA1 family)
VHGVCPEEFEQQMKYMARQYEPVSLIDVENYIAGRAAITKPSFALTFDDGYESVLEVAPLLKELGINPTVFVLGADACANRDELGNSHEFLSRAQIRTLYSAGWKIGSHSSTHADFWDLDPAEIRHEIEQSKKDLERDLKVPVEYFAYPRGRYNETAINSLQRAGYRLGFSMDDGFINQKTNVYTIPRVAINRTHTFAEFKASFAPLTILFRAVIKKIIGKNI